MSQLDLNELAQEFEDLEKELADINERLAEAREDGDGNEITSIKGELDEFEQERFEALRELASNFTNIPEDNVDAADFQSEANDHGTAVTEDELGDRVRDYWEGTTGEKANEWPYMHIDWKAAAEDMRADSSSFEWENESYYYGGIVG